MKIAAFGTWESPLTAEMTARSEKSSRTTNIVIDQDQIYWTEARPLEKGRIVIIQRKKNGEIVERTPPGYDVRSKVHEYGGLSFTAKGEVLYFINSKDQRLYSQSLGDAPLQLTESGKRFVEPVWTPYGLICIAEEHREKEVVNYLARVDLNNGNVSILNHGHDFYASPTLSPNGKKIAWLTWDHPYMPWDSTQLWVGDFIEGTIKNPICIAGGPEESIFQPQWSPKGNLFYVSDKSGWWNIHNQKENVYPQKAEFGLPLWGLGVSTWRFTGQNEQIICTYRENGVGKIGLLDPLKKKLESLDLGYSDYSQISVGNGFAVFLMGSTDKARRVTQLDLKTKNVTFIDSFSKLDIESGYFSHPESIVFPTTDNQEAYGYYYPPTNKDYKGIEGTLPPLIVMSHGGPTAAADPVFNLRIQFWTSRGWSVLDVNYRGSTGFGRKYREQLRGNWGLCDVEDCSNGALFLVRSGKVDLRKLVIRGSSAGGYTTLAALTFTKTFSAGASYYGVGDLELLLKDTHKFESQYLESLIGPYPAAKEEYRKRSPLYHAENIECPVIFFQGGKDKVVPPNQAEAMYKALCEKGIRTRLIVYPEEEHGFRKAENNKDSLEKELAFYLETFS